MLRLGGSLLEDLLSLDSGHRGPRVECGAGHQAEFVSYCAQGPRHGAGTGDAAARLVPLHGVWSRTWRRGDAELGVTGASLSPGLRRMVARVGARSPFAGASRDLAELAGLELTAKRVERSAEADGELVGLATEAEADALLAGRVVPFPGAEPVEKLYLALDGTGVPAPARSSWAACSPRAALTSGGGRCGTRARRATWPPWRPPSGSARWSTPRPCGGAWTVRGASAIVSLRCEDASGRWDDVWTRLHIQTTAA